MSLPGSASPPAPDSRRDAYAERSGEAVVHLIDAGITARTILTKQAFENAITVVMALGGSTNAVLHLTRDRQRGQGRSRSRRLQPHRRPRAAPGRRQAVRPLRHDRHRLDRRRSGRDEGAARRRPAARRRADRHRQDGGREPARHRPARPGRQDHPRDERPDPSHRRADHPARVTRRRGRGGQERRHGHRGLGGTGPGLRRRAGGNGRRRRAGACAAATSS